MISPGRRPCRAALQACVSALPSFLWLLKPLHTASHTPWGQEFCQVIAPWMWNLRLDLGQQLHPTPMCMTEFAPVQVVAPPQWARPSYTKGFAGADFSLQPNGTLRCPAGHPLYPQERRPERDASLRILYAARIGHCRPCPLRAQCQESVRTIKPRCVSAVIFPVLPNQTMASPPVETQPTEPALPFALLWGDWPRCQLRRRWMNLIRTEMVSLTMEAPPPEDHTPATFAPIITRAQRAHWRLTWNERFARNSRPSTAPHLEVTIHGLPVSFTQTFGFGLAKMA